MSNDNWGQKSKETHQEQTSNALTANIIGDEGVCALAEALRTNTTLTKLRLGGAATITTTTTSTKKRTPAVEINTKNVQTGLWWMGDTGKRALQEALLTNTAITAL